MPKQKKQKPGDGAGENAGDPVLIVRHQKLCIAIDMERHAIVGHSELQLVAGKLSVAELHSGVFDVTGVLVDGQPAKFERKQKTPGSSSRPSSPRVQSLEEAASYVFGKYTAALEAECSPDLLVTLRDPGSQSGESSQAGEASDATTPKPASTENEEGAVKLVLVQFCLSKPRASIFFKGNIFQNHPVEYWFPCVGSLSSRCSFHLEFTVHCDYTAVSAGNLLYQVLNKEDSRLKTFVYELKVPAPACFITLVVARLEVLPERQNSSLSYLCSPGHLAKLRSSMSCYYSLFSLYEDFLACAFPFGSYKQVFIEAEHSIGNMFVGASVVTFSSHLLVDERVIDQAIYTQIAVARGLAQQWFGVFITPETDRDAWLLEGLAGFLVHTFIRKFLGINEALFRKSKAFSAVTDADVEAFPPLSPPSVPAGAYKAERLGLVGKIRASKSLAVIQMLERQMGSEIFRKILQKIVSQGSRDASSRKLSTKEFRRLANKTGNLERPFLKDFFPRWVESQGSPYLRMGFEYNKKRNLVEFSVHRDCTAPEVILPGNKTIADVGWPGMMNIQIHELDGMYEHPNLSLSGDVHQLLELPCHSKIANRRAHRAKKPGKVEIIDDLADDKPVVDSPLQWLRADPGLDYLARIQLWQPESMWIYQLEKDKDVIAQLQAISALQKIPNSFGIVNALSACLSNSQVFCRVRIQAAFALAQTASEETSWAGLGHLINFFKSRCFEKDIGLLKPNNFLDFSEYFLLQAVPLAVATVRGNQGKSPPEAIDFILSVLKHNDNTGNPYSDSFWLSSLMKAVGELEISQQSMPKFGRILKQIDRYLQYDRLMPSFNNILTRSCIHTFTRLALKFNTVLPLDPLEKLLAPFKVVEDTPWLVRVAALQALMEIRYQSQGLSSTISMALDFVNEYPCSRVQTKLMSYALKICLRKNATTSVMDSSTVSSLLEMFASEACAMNPKLRHQVFTILQVLAGKPATLIRAAKLPPKVPPSTEARKEDPSKLKVRVTLPKPERKVTLRLKTSVFQDPEKMTSSIVLTPGDASSTRGAPPAAPLKLEAEPLNPASSSNQAPEINIPVVIQTPVAGESIETPSSQLKIPVEIIELKPEDGETKPEMNPGVATVEPKAEPEMKPGEGETPVKHKKEKKDKKDRKEKKEKKEKKDRDKKDKKDRKERKKEKKEKKEKHRDKEKKHKKRKHEEMSSSEAAKQQESGEQTTSSRPVNPLMQVKQEISEANNALTPPRVAPAPVQAPTGLKLKIKRPRIDV